ncbi:D-2-hydroxyacid dehydrogenase family protein [Nitrincola sp. MINF-07-Sa-05]|uniref:D-2-hydroxyacid dehydrogenase family protein n=1 Tax=Nitrincola salilacus TaxID=3400273 RepID=UPI003917CA02
MADWSSLAERVEVINISEHISDHDQLVEKVRDCQILVVMRERTPLSAELINRLPSLRLIITSGMRNASIDLTAAQERGITVCGTQSRSEPPTELTWALILGLARHITTEHAALRSNGPWQSTLGVSLHGKTLGLLGLGKIGEAVARVGQAFGMQVVAWSQNLTQERTNAVGVSLAASKEDLLSRSDVVSIHLVLSERTCGLVGAKELGLMKPSAFLVNTSRAAIIDQAALIHALEQGLIAGAGLDVFEQEPLPGDDPMRSLPNLLATPHLGYVADANYQYYFSQAVEDIHAFLAGEPIRELSVS